MDTTTLSPFGDLLKTLRKQHRVNQQELASRLGVHLNTISKWERGICLPDSKTLVMELARHLDLGPQDTRLLLEASLTALSPYWHVPYQRNPFFTGREEVLQRVHEALHQQQSALLSQSSALSGLGGIGKTQTAIEYAYRYANDYTAVFWVSAETTESLTSSFLALAEVLNLPEQREHEQQRIVSAVLRWLNSRSDWLLIFDNVEDIELVKNSLPSSRGGSLLFTSRRQALGITTQALDLHQMTIEEGMRLLLHRARLLEPTASLEQLDEYERVAAKELVRLMDGLPLALDQAGAYIEATRCSLSDYLRLFEASSLDLLDEREVHADHPASVARTFMMIFEQLEHDQSLAAELLTVCAFLAPEAIPEEFFVEGAAYLGPTLEALVTDPLAFQRAIKALLSYSLLQRHADTHTVTIHRLVQVVLRERLSPAIQHVWGERVIKAMTHLFPSEEETQANYRQIGERLLPHALICLALSEQWDEEDQTLSLSLMNHVATHLFKHAWYVQAEQLFERSLKVGEHTLGPEHLLVAEALHGQADLYRELGGYVNSEPLFQRALHIRELALGPEHPLVAETLNRLGILYREWSKYEQAETLFQRALQIWEQSLGPEHSRVASPLNNLGIIYYHQGKYEQAESLYQRSLHIKEQTLGSEHPQVAFSLSNLGVVYLEQGKYRQAEHVLQRDLHIRERALGPDHPQVAYPLTNLGNLYLAQGSYEQAERVYRRALHIRERALGPDHPQVAYPLCNLGDLYYKQERYEQAERMYRRTLCIWEQTPGPDSPQVAYPLNGLGNLYYEQGNYEQAESFYQRALTIRQQRLDQQHPDTAETLHDLARLRQAQQRDQEALALYQQALAIREQALGVDHPKTRETRTAYVQLLREVGRGEEAAEMEGQTPKTV